jgi:hypothetical protein
MKGNSVYEPRICGFGAPMTTTSHWSRILTGRAEGAGKRGVNTTARDRFSWWSCAVAQNLLR